MDVVSLFAGCGGLDLGFEKAGFDVIWANEYDKTIQPTYRLNHPKTILNTEDIRQLNSSDIPDCDGIIGGPPCQAWSEGGKQLGLKDPRGKLFLEYIRIVTAKQPKFFVIENVKGLLEDKHKMALSDFMRRLTDAGYKITYELLNAADYKIPQDRYRVFFIGLCSDLNLNYVFPDALCTKPVTLREAIGDIKESPRFFTNENIVTCHPTRSNHDVYSGPYDEKYMARNRVRSWDEPSFTLQAQARNIPQHPQAPKMIYLSSKKRIFVKEYCHLYRRLSVRECARIQTFPDNFHFIYSNIMDGYKMVGNAVPPRLAWCLSKQMIKTFDQIEDTSLVQPYKKPIQAISTIKINNREVFYRNNEENSSIKTSKRVLVALVKSHYKSLFINQSANYYYTGKKFPISIDMSAMYYFMPYIKGEGIRDLYIIKMVRTGTKQELDKSCNDDSLRVVFEIKFVKQLFPDYLPIHLNIWRTFTYATLSQIMSISKEEF